MYHEFEDHMLSAYLDEELSADERALVEQRLEIDPAARELLEDLKRLRGLVSTLPGWKGADLQVRHPERIGRLLDEQTFDELTFDEQSFSDADPIEPLARKSDAADAAVLDVDRSLRDIHPSELEVRAERRTQRSKRWTSIVAVAAGVGTLVLALPYVLRDTGPVTEIAHTPSAAQKTDVTSDFAAAGSSPLAKSFKDASTSGPAEFGIDLSREGIASEKLNDSSGRATNDLGQWSAKPPTLDLDGVVVAESTSPVPADGDLASRGVQLGTESSGLAGNAAPPGRAEPGANAPASSGLAIPLPTAEAATSAATDASAKADALSYALGGSLAGGAARGAMSAEKSLPQASRSMAPADVELRAAKEMEAAEAADAKDRKFNLEEPTLFYAYSQAWTATEVDSAITDVWSYVEPSANAMAIGANDESEQVRSITDGQAAPLSPGYRRNASRYNEQAPAVADTEPSPAVGIASLPTNQSVTQWYDQLQPANRLAQLNRLSRSAATASGTTLPGEPTESITPLRKKSLGELERGRAKQNQVKTGDSLALFVTVGEARSILTTLDAQRQAEAEAKNTANLNQRSTQAGAPPGTQLFRQQGMPEPLLNHQHPEQLETLKDQPSARAESLSPIQPSGVEPQPTDKKLSDQNASLRLQVDAQQDAATAQQTIQLPSLRAEKQAAGQGQRSAGQEPAGNAEATAGQGAERFGTKLDTAALLPPAWWARSSVLLQKGVSADNAKVILILNQAPVP